MLLEGVGKAQGWGQRGGSALTSEKTAAVVGEGVKDAVGCHGRDMRPLDAVGVLQPGPEIGGGPGSLEAEPVCVEGWVLWSSVTQCC